MEEEFNKWYKENKTKLQSEWMIGNLLSVVKSVWNAAINAVEGGMGDIFDGGSYKDTLIDFKVKEEA
jgi:hypothetical protein